jgi:hypothetical protein
MLFAFEIISSGTFIFRINKLWRKANKLNSLFLQKKLKHLWGELGIGNTKLIANLIPSYSYFARLE